MSVVNFETKQGKFAFVRAPNNFVVQQGYSCHQNDIGFTIHNDRFNREEDYFIRINNQFQIIEFAKDLTENQWKEVVDVVKWTNIHKPNESNLIQYYKDYVKFGDYNTATMSGKSLMSSLDVYTEHLLDLIAEGKIAYLPMKSPEWWQNRLEKTGNWLLIKYL